MSEVDRIRDALREMRTDVLDDAALERVVFAGQREARRVTRLVRISWLAAAASIVGLALLAATIGPREEGPPRTMTLPSGSIVALEPGAHASLRVDERGERVLVDSGSATFRVRPVRVGRIFRARTPLLTVVVVGTSFVLTARPRSAEVEVTSGRVRAWSQAGEERLLGAGDRAEVGADGRFVSAEVQDEAEEEPVDVADAGVRADEPRVPRDAGARFVERSSDEPAPEPIGDEPAPVAADVPSLPSTGAPPNPLAEARRLLLSRRYDEAAAIARSAGESIEARFVLADALRGAGHPGEAATLYRGIANGTDRDAENALYALARLHLERRGAPDRALALAGEHARRFASGALAEEFAITRWEALLRLRRNDDARAAIDDYLAHWPNGTRAGEARRLKGTLAGGE